MEAATIEQRPRLRFPRASRALDGCADERLTEMIAGGDADAFAVFYERHHRGLLSFCRHTLGSREEAEDVVQHTFLAAYRQLGEHDRTLEAPCAWLYTVARNRCLSVIRSRRESGRESPEPATAGLAEEVQRRADLRDLLSDVAELPEDQRSALILSELGDLSHVEIASILGRPTAQIKALVFRARSALIEGRTARDTTCADIREQLSTLTGGSLRRGPLRRHLKVCSGCSEFREQVRRQRTALGLILPVVPTIGLEDALAAASGAGGTGAAGLAGVGAGGAGAPALGVSAGSSKVFAGLALKAGVLKTAAVVAATGAAAAGGGVAIERAGGPDSRPASESRAGALAQGANPGAATDRTVGSPNGDSAGPTVESGRKANGRLKDSSAGQRRRGGVTPERGGGDNRGLGGGKARGRGSSSRGASNAGGRRDRPGARGGRGTRNGGNASPPTKRARPERTRRARLPAGGQGTGDRPALPGNAPRQPVPNQRPDEPGATAPRGRAGRPKGTKPVSDSSS